MKEPWSYTDEDMEVLHFIARKMGRDSARRLSLAVLYDRADNVMKTVQLYRRNIMDVRIVEVEHWEEGARRYVFWYPHYNPKLPRTHPTSTEPGLRIVMPWEDTFEDARGDPTPPDEGFELGYN